MAIDRFIETFSNRLTSVCSRIATPLRALSIADAERYTAILTSGSAIYGGKS